MAPEIVEAKNRNRINSNSVLFLYECLKETIGELIMIMMIIIGPSHSNGDFLKKTPVEYTLRILNPIFTTTNCRDECHYTL